ncbi:MetQ/NlpA family ABC transporter substrate-binding protein [Bacillus horti]|uniref:Lipoprotein n=1 Tax=Caldalkalibacillus horti TaxID=77523 RepID=A0ABT9W5L2_9BACI|nr:MetQ/NlpA family ABC transporter substrate-binding protein [Bacillus horti]MDQ0168537.1 D-methionine transport system substrate-binding protein [Bacillus horti]
MKTKFLLTVGLLIGVLALSACGNSSASGDTVEVSIGVTGADGQYWDIIKDKAAEEGISIKLIEFQDYTLPNHALANGEVDINSFQHLAFLSQFNAENNTEIVPIGSTIIAPLGLYSEKFTDLAEIPDGAQIAIPDDPANLGRGLKLLAAAGFIELKEEVGLYPTLTDIVSNSKNIDIVPIVAQQTPRVLPDVAASVINSGIAGQAGLYLEDSIFHDDPYSEEARPYINVFAVNAEDKNNEAYKTIARIYQEQEVIDAVHEDTNGGSIVVDIDASELEKNLNELIEGIK